MIFGILLCCCNGSMIDNTSTNTSTTPDNNFYGILEDHFKKSQVESILIGGKYESIPVYQDILKSMVDKKDGINESIIDPKQNRILINLKDIKSIALKHPESLHASSVSINNKKYVQIVVTSISGVKKEFLIEGSRRITCKEVDPASEKQDAIVTQDRDLNFTHIKKLIIHGYKSDKQQTSSTEVISASHKFESKLSIEEKNKFKVDTAQILNSIEENIKNLPTNNPTAFQTMKETVLLLLKSLKDQLQKFLDMVK